MKICVSSLEQVLTTTEEGYDFIDVIKSKKIPIKYCLVSYLYASNGKGRKLAEKIRDNCEELLVDSGAHTFRHGAKKDFVEYTKEYAKFISEFDRPNVIGYFEMDIDNVIGYEEVKKLRKELEKITDKIVPVWHRNRGIKEFEDMCKEYTGKLVAITGFAGAEIRDEQYIMFMKIAKKYNCKLHCLGMTRKKILDRVPFDYVDSSSWKQTMIFGKPYNTNHKSKKFKKTTGDKTANIHQTLYCYQQSVKMQQKYYEKWRKYEDTNNRNK